MRDQYGVADLLGACIDAVESRSKVDPNEVEYELIRCSVLARAFGLRITAVDPGVLPAVKVRAYKTGREAWEDDVLAEFLEACLRLRGQTISPFRDYLEAPESIIGLYQRFGRISELAGAGARASFDYMLHELTVAAAASLWGLPEDATVSVDLSSVLPSTITYDIDRDYDD